MSSLGFPNDLPLNGAAQILPPTDDEYSAAMAELSEISGRTARHAANFGALPDPGEQGLAAAHHEFERLQTELDTLKSAAGKPSLPAAPSDADLAAMAQKLQDSLDRITLLKSQLEQRRNMKPPEAPPPKAGVSSQEVITGKKPIIVKLIGGRVVPLAEPYFSITKHFVATNCADVIEVTRQRDGEPLEAATDDGGISDCPNAARGSADALLRLLGCAGRHRRFSGRAPFRHRQGLRLLLAPGPRPDDEFVQRPDVQSRRRPRCLGAARWAVNSAGGTLDHEMAHWTRHESRKPSSTQNDRGRCAGAHQYETDSSRHWATLRRPQRPTTRFRLDGQHMQRF